MKDVQTQLEQNKAIARRYMESWAKPDPTFVATCYAPELTAGLEEAIATQGFAAFTDMEVTIDVMIAEGAYVAVRWHTSALHSGEYDGILATGRRVTCEGMSLIQIVGGKIVSDPGYWDNHAIREQLR